jgi:hypothetical protein
MRPDRRHFVILNWDQRAANKAAEWAKDPGNANSRITVVSPSVTDSTAAPQSNRMEVVHGDPKSMEILDQVRVQDAKLVLVCSAWGRADLFDRRGSMDVELADNYTIRAIHDIRMLGCRSRDKDPVLIDAEIYLESNWAAAKSAGGPAVVLQPPQSGTTRYIGPSDRNSESTSSAAPN